jgi:Recombinase
MSEYELDLLRQRAKEARTQKARRGEFLSNIPIGFVKSEDSVLEKDPDERIRRSIDLVFTKFLEFGSASQVLIWFMEHELAIPARTMSGDIHWRRPAYGNIHRVLTNPFYGGAYAYGKTESVVRYASGPSKTRSRRRGRDQWGTPIHGAHEGYVEWEKFERIQRMIRGNRFVDGEPSGAARRGLGLLGGVEVPSLRSYAAGVLQGR